MLTPSIERKVWLGDDWIDFKNKASLNAGIKINYAVTKNFSVETGLELNDKGSRFQAYWLNAPSLDTPLVKKIEHVWYVTVPLELSYSSHLSSDVSILFQSGLLAGRKVWDFQIDNVEGERSYYHNQYSSTSEFFYGFRIGVGINIQIIEQLSLEFQPNYTRQLNRGWGKSSVASNDGRYDSYSLKTVLWVEFD